MKLNRQHAQRRVRFHCGAHVVQAVFAVMTTIACLCGSGVSHAAEKRSISQWVSCNSSSSDAEGVAKAFAAASQGAFTLVVDCPVNVKIGSDIGQTIFIDTGTSVEFTPGGKFIVDNLFIPTFVIANSSGITLTDWNVEFVGSLPIKPTTTYLHNGRVGEGKPGDAFNDIVLTQWLTAHRGVSFNTQHGSIFSVWSGTTNACAVFFITGNSYQIAVTGLHLYVPATAGAHSFIPAAVTLSLNYKSRQAVTARTPMTEQYVAIPHDMTFTDITLDGTYMGFLGSLSDTVFDHIESIRYGDLQDANGKNAGGVGKWFAPPHLFYLKSAVEGNTVLTNSNIQISNVIDEGRRFGNPRDKGGTDSISGFADSLKIGCTHCSVDTYTSNRPDGLMDILDSNGLTVSNVIANYDSSFTHEVYSAWRLPDTTYKNVKFENITLTDTAASTYANPIGNSTQNAEGIVFSNVKVIMHRWDRSTMPLPSIGGSGNTIALDYYETDTTSRYVEAVNDTLQVQLSATQSSVKVGQTTMLPWMSRQANSCAGSAGMVGSSGTNGVRSAKLEAIGHIRFALECRNNARSASAIIDVSVAN